MKSIPFLLSRDDAKWLDVALENEGVRFDEILKVKEDLMAAYTQYDNIVASVNSPLPKSVFEQDKYLLLKIRMIELYSSPPQSLKELLIERRRNHNLEYCPYCGSPNIPDTLDHFVPKDILAEYSIYPNNLVPQCRTCAPIKGKKYFSEKNKEVIFIHPLYFTLLSTISLEIDVGLSGHHFSFVVSFLTTSTNNDEQKKITSHVSALRIKKRVELYCHKEVKRWERKLLVRSFDIENAFRTRIMEFHAEDDSCNWKVALYTSLLKNEKAMKHFKSIKVKSDKKMKVIIQKK
jgi:hypothetical protein